MAPGLETHKGSCVVPYGALARPYRCVLQEHCESEQTPLCACFRHAVKARSSSDRRIRAYCTGILLANKIKRRVIGQRGESLQEANYRPLLIPKPYHILYMSTSSHDGCAISLRLPHLRSFRLTVHSTLHNESRCLTEWQPHDHVPTVRNPRRSVLSTSSSVLLLYIPFITCLAVGFYFLFHSTCSFDIQSFYRLHSTAFCSHDLPALCSLQAFSIHSSRSACAIKSSNVIQSAGVFTTSMPSIHVPDMDNADIWCRRRQFL